MYWKHGEVGDTCAVGVVLGCSLILDEIDGSTNSDEGGRCSYPVQVVARLREFRRVTGRPLHYARLRQDPRECVSGILHMCGRGLEGAS